MFYEVIPTEIFRTGGTVLTYSSPISLKPGHIVLVPLGPRLVTGVVKKHVKSVDFPVKPISRLLHPLPLPTHLLKAANWLSNYYLAPLPTTVNLLIPAGLTARNAIPPHPAENTSPSTLKLPLIPLNSAQEKALRELMGGSGNTALLRGVTGSGKTNIYLKLAENALKAQKSTILLVPEIALTSQLVRIFEETFGDRVIVMHSNLTMVERRKAWLKIHSSASHPLIIIGPRSALLTPVHNLGQIIIDEAHENAYFQENTPRYSALRLASFIASQLKIPCLLGSATPNLVDYHLAHTHHSLVELSERAKSTAIDPKITIIDLKNRANFTKNRYFSNLLLENIQQNIENHHQTLIFHNRRGSAPLTLCENCGWQALCPNCYLPMTLHTDNYTLVCHLCGHEEKVPKSCPQCQTPGIIHKGFGTKLLESELARLFPNAKIARFDGDNKKGQDLAHLYTEVKSGVIDILIGTQTLARGLDLPHLASVGIIQADAGLALPDFSAEERTFELLTQVIGRVGRGHLDTAKVFVQTYQPDSPVIQTAIKTDFPTFADYLLKTRRRGQLPPFSYIAKLSVTYKTEKTALAKIRAAHSELSQIENLTVSPPQPAFHERVARGFTWQIILKSPSRTTILAALEPFSTNKNFAITLDPPSLL
jgi:primosomal protein N' (replication factor Y)